MQYDPDDLVLDASLLRERAARCFRLARTLPASDAAVLDALGHEYEAEAARLESAPAGAGISAAARVVLSGA